MGNGNGRGLDPKEIEERNLLETYVTQGRIPDYISANAKRLLQAGIGGMGLPEAEALVRQTLTRKLERYGIECNL